MKSALCTIIKHIMYITIKIVYFHFRKKSSNMKIANSNSLITMPYTSSPMQEFKMAAILPYVIIYIIIP